MKKGVTCHKTETSFVMRFTKEVWLACNANEADLFANEVHQHDVNLKPTTKLTKSSRKNANKDVRKFNRSWSTNAEDADDHILSNVSIGQKQEENCTKLLIDTLSRKVKRHRKTQHTKKTVRPKRTMSCQEYDMSAIEGIFANDSTIEYDSDKTVDLNFSISENKSTDGPVTNSFINSLALFHDLHSVTPLPPGFLLEKACKSPNKPLSRLTCSIDECISVASPTLNNSNHISCQKLSEVDLMSNPLKINFVPSTSSAFNINFTSSLSKTSNIALISDQSKLNNVASKSPEPVFSSFPNFPQLSYVSEISENPKTLEGLNISNCTDILDSSSTSLSTIDFYINHSGFTPLNRSPNLENTKSITELAEKKSNPECSSTDESKSNRLKVSLNTASNQDNLLEVNPFSNNKSDVLCEEKSDLPKTSQSEERSVESKHCKDKLLDDNTISSDHINPFVKNTRSLNKKATSKKSSHPQRGRKRKKRRNTTRINEGKSLKHLSDSLNYSEDQDLVKPADRSIGANFDDGFQGETDTDTIPLELDDGFVEADSTEIPFDSDSKEFVYSSCNDVIPRANSNSNVGNSLKEDPDSNVTCPDINNLDCNGNASTTMQSKNTSANVNINSDFTVLSIGSEIPGEVLRHRPVDLPKLEAACDAMSDDLEIVDLEDIEVDEVVNFSEEAKDSLSQNIIERNMADKHCMEVMDESSKVGEHVTDSELHSKDNGENIKYVDDLQDTGNELIKDSNLVIGLGDYEVSDDSPAGPSEEFTKAESEESTQDMLPSIQPSVECLEDLTFYRHNNEKEEIIPKETLTTRKWERPNIFENLAAKVNLPIKGENVKINSNFAVNSFAQKLVVELLGESDEITFKAKNNFSIENMRKVNHNRASGQSQMNVFPAVIDIDEPVTSEVLDDSSSDNEQQGENISFTGESLERSFEKSREVPEQAVDQSIHNFVATSTNALPVTNDFVSNMDSLNKDAFAGLKPSARKSFKSFIGRFVKRLTHSSKRYISHSATIMKSKLKNSLIQKTTAYSKIAKESKQELSDQEILHSEVMSLVTEGTHRRMPVHEHDFSKEAVIPISSSESIIIPGLDSPPESFSCGFNQANTTFSSQSGRKMGINSKVNVKTGVHLTSSFQPHVSIIPLPLESLTRLAMKTNQECESLSYKDENSFEAVNESLAHLSVAARRSEFECVTNFAGIDSSLSGNTSDAGEESKFIDKKNPSILEERAEAWNARKRKSSFLEALNVPQVQSHGQRRSKRTTRDDSKLIENDEKPCPDNISKPFDKAQENISDKTKKKPSTIISGRSRSKSRKSLSAEKMPTLSASKSSESFLQSKDFLTSMESILPLIGKSNVMSLPKIRKISDSNSGGFLPQRGCESYGVLEKLEKAMAEDELKKFNTQNIKKVGSSSVSSANKSHAMSLTSSTLTSPKGSENLSTQSNNHARGFNPDHHSSGRGASLSDKNVNQRNFRAFNLSNQEHQPLAVASKPDMKVGVDLPWMRKNRSHDPLGLVEDEEICESDKLQSNLDKANIGRGVKSDSWPAPRRRLRFITPQSLEIENQKFLEPELNRDESYFVSKLSDDLRDLEVIVGVQQRMANPENEEPGYLKNAYRYGESCVSSGDNCRRPFWKSKFERGYFQRPHFFEPFNSRRYVRNSFDNRGCRWPQFPKKFQDYPTPESANMSSLFQTPSSSGSEGGFVQNVDYTDADECQSKVAEGEAYSEKATEEGHFKRQQGKFAQQPPWRSSYNYYPWQPTRKHYKQSGYGRDEGSNGLNNEKALPDPRSFHTPPYHDFSYYSYPCSQDIASNSIYNNFANQDVHHDDGTRKSSQLLSLVKSKVTKHLSRSPVSVENHQNIVEDIMRKLASEHHKALMMKAKANIENEEGECDDSECENATDSDLDYMIKQYLQEFGPYYIASQTHPRTQHH